MTKQTKKVKLDPIDLNQCQAEVPNGYSFMTLGGVPGRVRCKTKPAYVVHKTKSGEDGLQGAMSLCSECLVVALKQLPAGSFTTQIVKGYQDKQK